MAVSTPTGGAPAEPAGRAAPATLLVTGRGRVTACSGGAETLFGLRPGDALGRDVRALLVGASTTEMIDEALSAAAQGETWHGILRTCATTATTMDGEPAGDSTAGPAAEPSTSSTSGPASGGIDLDVVVEPLTAEAPGADGSQQDAPQAPASWVLITAARRRLEGFELINEAGRRVGSTLDLGRTAQEVVDVALPDFADAAAVYVLERILADEHRPGTEEDGSVVVRRLAAGFATRDRAAWAAAFPIDEVIVYGPGSPHTECTLSGRPVRFSGAEAMAVFSRRGKQAPPDLRHHTSMLTAPLVARGQVLGFVLFSRERTRLPFSAVDARVAAELASTAATRIDNARLYQREHRTAGALQHSLYPAHITVPPGLEVAHRYLPAGDATQVGGDWYDVVPLPGDRVALVIGDAMGHGIAAAAAMGQLRVAAHTLASLNLTPAEILRRLDVIAQNLDAAQFATCICAVCDPVARTCTIAGAGHPPALLADPDGGTRILSYAPGPPLGVGDPGSETLFTTTEVAVPMGSTLVFYTDGLIENRVDDLDTGIAALRAAMTSRPSSLDETADALLAGLRHRLGTDDIALMLVRPK